LSKLKVIITLISNDQYRELKKLVNKYGKLFTEEGDNIDFWKTYEVNIGLTTILKEFEIHFDKLSIDDQRIFKPFIGTTNFKFLIEENNIKLKNSDERTYDVGNFELISENTITEKYKGIEIPEVYFYFNIPEYGKNDSMILMDNESNNSIYDGITEWALPLFQAASQFNCLEMTSPKTTPESGIEQYNNDLTQGPAVAIGGFLNTLYRNYGFVPRTQEEINSIHVNGKQIITYNDITLTPTKFDITIQGQYNNYQINTLYPFLKKVQETVPKGDDISIIKDYSNGYWKEQIIFWNKINKNSKIIQEMIKYMTVGLVTDTPIVAKKRNENLQTINLKKVSQVYVSAFPFPRNNSTPLAKEILKQAYYTTLLTAVHNCMKKKETNKIKIFLTLVGGGAFGNNFEWIYDAILYSINKIKQNKFPKKITLHVYLHYYMNMKHNITPNLKLKIDNIKKVVKTHTFNTAYDAKYFDGTELK
jgi:hypothetical protein